MSLFSASLKTWNRISKCMNHQKRDMSSYGSKKQLVNLLLDHYEQWEDNMPMVVKYEEDLFNSFISVEPVFLSGRGDVEGARLTVDLVRMRLGYWNYNKRINSVLRSYEKRGVTSVGIKRSWLSLTLEPLKLQAQEPRVVVVS